MNGERIRLLRFDTAGAAAHAPRVASEQPGAAPWKESPEDLLGPRRAKRAAPTAPSDPRGEVAIVGRSRLHRV